LSANPESPAAPAALAPSRWGPFQHRAFAVIWLSSLILNIGTAMFDTASAWLMTSLNADPMAVSLVQVFASLPIFLFTLPAGALADIIDERRLLLGAEIATVVVASGFATLVTLHLATPFSLLLTIFLVSASLSLTAPAWLSLTPLLVTRPELDGASAANSVGYNIARAVGPAIGGVAIAALGVEAPIWLFAACALAIIAALLWWRSPRKGAGGLPAERLTSAVRTGLRYAANSGHMRATLMRTLAYFPFASAYWALLPLVARDLMAKGGAFEGMMVMHGPALYGILLGALGVGAIVGSLGLKWMKARLGPDRLAAFGTLATAGALVLFGFARDPLVALAGALLAGASWTIVLATLYVSAQVALPDWVRARGLAVLLTVVFGAMSVGSAAWGRIAGMEDLRIAFFIAAAGAALAIPLTWRWKLQTAAGIDLTPSMHWRVPAIVKKVENDEGPALVTIEYRIEPDDREAFVGDLDELGHERKRDGAYAWGIFEDVADRGRFVETFLIESWLELQHLRERVTNADRIVEDRLHKILAEPPQITLLIASDNRRRSRRERALELQAAPPAPAE
jgi:MFS family permease